MPDTRAEKIRLRTELASGYIVTMGDTTGLSDVVSPPENDGTPSHPIFAIFEGGGAKGVAHIGAVKAAETMGFTFVGLAGASAGAFVAAFIAAGFTANELFNPDRRGDHLLARDGKSPTDLLGPVAWRFFGLAQGAPRLAIVTLIIGSMIGAFSAGPWGIVAGPAFTLTVFVLLFAPAVVSRGWFSPARAEVWINEQLVSRLKQYHRQAGTTFSGAHVCFADLDPELNQSLAGRVFPLKIIATDIDAGSMFVFGTKETPNVKVSEAVAASIAIPGVFRPARVPSLVSAAAQQQNDPAKHAFADGGMVSNLPVWAFVEEKLAWEKTHPERPRVPIVAFRLDEPAAKAGDPAQSVTGSFWRYAGAVLRSGIFGGQRKAQEFVEDLFIVSLQPQLGVLAFDASHGSVADAFETGRKDATAQISHELRLRPAAVEGELHRIADAARELFGNSGLATPRDFRACVFISGGAFTLKIAFSWNMQTDADDRLILDRRGPGAAQAFRERRALHVALGRPVSKGQRDYLTKYARALVRPTVKSAICAPIFRDIRMLSKRPLERSDSPLGVLCIDSDVDLSQSQKLDDVLRWLQVEAAGLISVIG